MTEVDIRLYILLFCQNVGEVDKLAHIHFKIIYWQFVHQFGEQLGQKSGLNLQNLLPVNA